MNTNTNKYVLYKIQREPLYSGLYYCCIIHNTVRPTPEVLFFSHQTESGRKSACFFVAVILSRVSGNSYACYNHTKHVQCSMDTQATLKQPIRSGKLIVGMPNVRGKKKVRAPICDGRCLLVKKCTKCLRKRAKEAVDRTARLHKRQIRRVEGDVAHTHQEVKANDARRMQASKRKKLRKRLMMDGHQASSERRPNA